MINKLDGKIAFDSFSLTPNITLQAFKSLLKSNQIVSHEENEMAINIYLLPQKCGDKYFSIRLYFSRKNKVLTHLLISLQKNASIPSWTSWSEKDQLEVKKADDSWLSEEIGDIPPYKFSWGEITSVYNQREGSSYIAIKYY